MRPRAHELETQLRSLTGESLRECGSASESRDRLHSRGALGMLGELAAENDLVLAELEQTQQPKVAVLNRPELVHFADFLGSVDTVLQQLLHAVESPLAARHLPHSGIWRSYSAALVNLHRGAGARVVLPKPKGHEKYYLPYIQFMNAADPGELETARVGIAKSFAARNRDRRFTDWFGLDGDGERPVRWDFRLSAIEAGTRRSATGA